MKIVPGRRDGRADAHRPDILGIDPVLHDGDAGQRRKTAANAIASGLGMPKDAVTAAIEAAGFDARIRPEALTLEDFAKIQQALAR